MNTRIVGIDCATENSKIGLARGEMIETSVKLDEACVCSRDRPAVDILTQWLSDLPRPILLAMDAPLGWPSKLSTVLIEHVAGAEILVQPNVMFRRATDRFVQEKLGKTPLDVGANRIARTAHSALALLGACAATSVKRFRWLGRMISTASLRLRCIPPQP